MHIKKNASSVTELLEILAYIEDSTDNIAKLAKGNLVKNIHMRVQEVKNDVLMEVEKYF